MKTASFQTYIGPGRISIARYAPPWTKPGFAAFPALAPGKWFRSVDKETYVELFQKEVLRPLDPRKTLTELRRLADGAEPVLLCWEKPPFDEANWCHRRLVASWFAEKLGLDVPEMLDVPPEHAPQRRAKKTPPAQPTLLDLDERERPHGGLVLASTGRSTKARRIL